MSEEMEKEEGVGGEKGKNGEKEGTFAIVTR